MSPVAGVSDVDAVADEPLTTKEGWRRFVDHQPHPPVLLDAAALATLSPGDRTDYDEARREYHADLPLANTPIIQTVISTSRLLVQLNRNQVSARRGVIISGAWGTGKTTALTQLGRTHERHSRKRYPADRHRLPVLYVTVPPAATPRMLAVEFARFLGLEFSGRANITDIVNAVCATVRAQRHHLRLLGRHGPAAAYDAVLTGFLFCGHVWADRREDGVGVHREWTRRAEVLIPPGSETATFSASRLFAAVYPEAVRLAGLIASPTWRHLAAGEADQRRQFTTEVGRRLHRPHHPGDGGDAVAHWMMFDC